MVIETAAIDHGVAHLTAFPDVGVCQDRAVANHGAVPDEAVLPHHDSGTDHGSRTDPTVPTDQDRRNESSRGIDADVRLKKDAVAPRASDPEPGKLFTCGEVELEEISGRSAGSTIRRQDPVGLDGAGVPPEAFERLPGVVVLESLCQSPGWSQKGGPWISRADRHRQDIRGAGLTKRSNQVGRQKAVILKQNQTPSHSGCDPSQTRDDALGSGQSMPRESNTPATPLTQDLLVSTMLLRDEKVHDGDSRAAAGGEVVAQDRNVCDRVQRWRQAPRENSESAPRADTHDHRFHDTPPISSNRSSSACSLESQTSITR